jgi:hypothetical protein
VGRRRDGSGPDRPRAEQIAILAAAFVMTAVVLLLLPADGARPRLATVLRAHRPLAAAAIVGALALALVSPSARGDVLGSYATPLAGDVLPAGTWAAGRELPAYVVMGIGGIPLALAAAWVALTISPAPRVPLPRAPSRRSPSAPGCCSWSWPARSRPATRPGSTIAT